MLKFRIISDHYLFMMFFKWFWKIPPLFSLLPYCSNLPPFSVMAFSSLLIVFFYPVVSFSPCTYIPCLLILHFSAVAKVRLTSLWTLFTIPSSNLYSRKCASGYVPTSTKYKLFFLDLPFSRLRFFRGKLLVRSGKLFFCLCSAFQICDIGKLAMLPKQVPIYYLIVSRWTERRYINKLRIPRAKLIADHSLPHPRPGWGILHFCARLVPGVGGLYVFGCWLHVRSFLSRP